VDLAVPLSPVGSVARFTVSKLSTYIITYFTYFSIYALVFVKLNKAILPNVIQNLNLDENIRSEKLSIQQFGELAEKLK